MVTTTKDEVSTKVQIEQGESTEAALREVGVAAAAAGVLGKLMRGIAELVDDAVSTASISPAISGIVLTRDHNTDYFMVTIQFDREVEPVAISALTDRLSASVNTGRGNDGGESTMLERRAKAVDVHGETP